LASAIDVLMRGYDDLAGNAVRIGPTEFSIKTMVENHRSLYAL
jgi:hypothetical protein